MEYELPWGTDGLVLRESFGLNVTFRPGKNSTKSSVSFWEAKKMLGTLSVHFDHASVLPSPKLQDTTIVVLSFFKKAAFDEAKSILEAIPNHTVFAQGNAVGIEVQSPEKKAINKLPKTTPNFDKKMKGCRPDTVYLKHLPAKWFDVNMADLAEMESKSAQYNAPEHKLVTLFSEFGPVSHVEPVPPQNTDEDAILSSVHFNLYVQFKNYESVVKIMDCMQGDRILCHNSHPKVIVALDITLDTTEYLSDASIRQRRFKREQRQIELAQEAAEEERKAKQLAADIENAKASAEKLEKQLQEKEASATQLLGELDTKLFGLFNQVASAIDHIRRSPSRRLVLAAEKAMDNLLKNIGIQVQEHKEQELAKQRKKWLKQVSQQCQSSDDRVNAIEGRFTSEISNHAFCDHPAVVADLKAAKDAISAASATINHPIPVDKPSTTEEDVQKYMEKLQEDVEEAEYQLEAALARLDMMTEYHALKEEVQEFNDSSILTMVNALEKAWGDSTSSILEKMHEIRRQLSLSRTKKLLTERLESIAIDITDDELHRLRESALSCIHALPDKDKLGECEDALKAYEEYAKELLADQARRQEKEMSFESMYEAKNAAIQAARKRLREWEDEHSIKRSKDIVKCFQMNNRWPCVRSLDQKEDKAPRRSLIEREVPASLQSIVYVVQADGNVVLPTPVAEKKTTSEELSLRTQVIESQKRKEALAFMQRLKEKELRQQALKSVLERSHEETTTSKT